MVAAGWSPGVAEGAHAQPGAQVLGLRGAAQPGGRRGLAPAVGHDPWVVPGPGRQRVGVGTADVARLDRPPGPPARLQPRRCGPGLALGTRAMTTGVVGDGVVTAVVARLHVAA